MTAGLSALRFLVVDDNDQMRMIFGAVLSAADARHVHYATNGAQGLAALASGEFDVVFVDYEMPVMNGLQFLKAVRESQPPMRFVPIIMVTGHSDLKRLRAARDLGANEFLCKPVSANSILQRISAVIYQPRPFVSSPTYFGPDRRRRRPPGVEHPMRRKDDLPPDAE